MPVGNILVEWKIKGKNQECGQDKHPGDPPHRLTTGPVRQHRRHDQADQSFFRKWSFTQFFNMPSAR
jgi:hypothetical protein